MTGVGASAPSNRSLRSVLIVGTGLIGTSIAMALADRGIDVALTDADDGVLRQAIARSGARVWDGGDGYDVMVAATPPLVVATVIEEFQRRGVASTYTDVAGIKSQVQLALQTFGADMSSVVGGHPFAGRERGGPASADSQLFTDRPWVLCPTPTTSADALLRCRSLVEAVGGVVVITSAEQHDEAAAWLSHVPQLLASALAAGASDIGERELALAGQGFRDLTRIADSPPPLWEQVVRGNARAVHRALARLQESLEPLLDSDDARAGEAAARLVAAGNHGRELLPTKAGRRFAGDTVVVVVEDRQGQLARLLRETADADVNVEDVHVQHGARAARGLVDIDVSAGRGAVLASALERSGWHCWVAAARP